MYTTLIKFKPAFLIFAVLTVAIALPTQQIKGQCGACPDIIGYVQAYDNADCDSCNAWINLCVIGNHSPFTYQWNNGDTTEDVSGLCAGSYSVTVTDSQGHTKIVTFEIYEDECPPCEADGYAWQISPASCQDGGKARAQGIGPNGPFTYLWNTGQTGNIINNLLPGTYTVTITDANGCTAEREVKINGSTGLSLAGIVTNTNCDSTNGKIDLTVTGGTPGYTYNWNDGASTKDRTDLAAGIYSVTITDINGCKAFGSFNVLPSTAPTVSLQVTNSKCQEANGYILATGSNGSGQYQFNWQGPAGYTASSAYVTTHAITGLEEGLYFVTLTDAAGCSVSAMANLQNSGVPKDTTIFIPACDTTYLPDGTEVTENSVIERMFQTALQCDSLVTYVVTFGNNGGHCIRDTIGCEQVVFNGQTYTSNATVQQVVTSSEGCTDTIDWHIKVLHDVIFNDTLRACAGLVWNGQQITADTTVTETVLSDYCSASKTILFEFTQPNHENISYSQCGLQSQLTFQNVVLDAQTGCPTTIQHVTLTPQPFDADTTLANPLFICSDHDTTYVQTVDVQLDFQNCKKITVQQEVIIQEKPADDYIMEESCNLDSVGLHVTIGENCTANIIRFVSWSGIAEHQQQDSLVCLDDPLVNTVSKDTVTNVNGCLVELTTWFKPRPQVFKTVELKTCPNETVVFQGQSYSTGIYPIVIPATTDDQCDTLGTLIVTDLPVQKFEINQDTCNKNAAGQSFWTIQTGNNGCQDSIKVTLDWEPGFYVSTTVDTCIQGLTPIRDTIQIGDCFGISDTIFNFVSGNNTVLDPVTICPNETVELEGVIFGPWSADTVVTIFAIHQTTQGCVDTIFQNVFVRPLPNISLFVTQPRCGEIFGKIALGSHPADWIVFWSNGSISDTIVVAPGEYSVVVNDGNGCESEAVVTIHPALPLPEIVLAYDSIACDHAGKVWVYDAPPGATFTWAFNGVIIPNATTDTITAMIGGNYNVTVTNSAGCTANTFVYLATPNCRPKIKCEVQIVRNANSVSVSIKPEGGGNVQLVEWHLWAASQANRLPINDGIETDSPWEFEIPLPILPLGFSDYILTMPLIVVDGVEYELTTAGGGNAFCFH